MKPIHVLFSPMSAEPVINVYEVLLSSLLELLQLDKYLLNKFINARLFQDKARQAI